MKMSLGDNRWDVKKIRFHHRVKRFYYKNLFRKIYTVAIIWLIAANVFSLFKYQSFAEVVNGVNYNITYSDTETKAYIIWDNYTNNQWCWCIGAQECEQNCSNLFFYGTITIPRAWHDDIIIMDRNLWATKRWNKTDVDRNNNWTYYDGSTTPSSYWYHYQWWNNYWFSPRVTPNTQSTLQIRSSDSYANFRFITENDVWYDWMNYPTSYEWEQWPCPEWWHVPSAREWQNVYNALNAWNDGEWLAEALLLPPAGMRDRGSYAHTNSIGNRGFYRSNLNNTTNAVAFTFDSASISNDNSLPSIGGSIRCFKDIPPTATLNANWWTVASNTITADDQWQITLPTATRAADSNGERVFEWWFASAWDSEKVWRAGETITITANTMLYAHWAQTITIRDPANPLSWFTIMDRNLWAISNEISSTGSYWFKYQWWNNYWFSDSDTPVVTTTWLAWSGDYDNHGYYNTKWINWSSNDYDVWDGNNPTANGKEHHDWLRWWASDSSSNNRWLTSTAPVTWRQWPCPEWWHIPSAWEWSKLLEYWVANYTWSVSLQTNNNLKYFETNSTASEAFQTYFKLPFAGTRSHLNASLFETGSIGKYWSSSPYGSSYPFNARVLDLRSSVVYAYNYNGRSFGRSVRCFKDEYVPVYNVTFEPENGAAATTQKVLKDQKATVLNPAPTRAWYTLKWWYLSWSESAFDFTGTAITWNITLYAKWNIDCPEWYIWLGDTCVESVTVTFDTKWWSSKESIEFEKGMKLREKEKMVAISSNSCMSSYEYMDDMCEIVVLPWVDAIDLEISYSPSYSVMAIWQWSRPNCGLTYYSYHGNDDQSVSWILSSWKHNYTISWDTVTIGYLVTDDHSGCKWSYSATLTWVFTTSEWIGNDPTRPWYLFAWWYTDEELTQPLTFLTPITNDITLYAKWTKFTELTTWQDFNAKIKNLANDSTSLTYNSEDTNIEKFERSTTPAPDLVRTEIISSQDSVVETVAWYENGTIKYYTDAEIIYMNQNSSYMFQKCSNLKSVDLYDLNTSKVTNISSMFYNCSKIRTIYSSTSFNISKVTSSSNMFYNTKKLVWWNGTKFVNSYTEKSYARPDVQWQVWYFTDKDAIKVKFIIWNTEYASGAFSYWKISAPEDPTWSGYAFSSRWAVQGSETDFDFKNDNIVEYTELYSKYTCADGYILDWYECVESVVLSFDSNWWTDKESIELPKWTKPKQRIRKYSHTENITDDGIQVGDYGTSRWNANIRGTDRTTASSEAHVASIPGASSLHVTIDYWSYAYYYDWVSMWIWSHSNYTAYSNYSSSVTKQLWWTRGTKTYDVSWDTVTFSFRSTSSNYGWDRYWYYAVVEWETYTVWDAPTRTWYVFSWWYTELEGWEEFNPETMEVNDDMTLHAHWDCDTANGYTWDNNGGCEKVINITVTFNPNWWTTATWTITVESWSTINLSDYTASKSDHEFLGWNTNSTATVAIPNSYTANSDIILYAIYRKAPSSWTLASWDFQALDIKSWKRILFTILDRNLWATSTWAWSSANLSSYGSYYQWWNNYGFANSGAITTGSAQVEASLYSPSFPYFGYTFIVRKLSPYGWDSTNNYNLWWWEWDSTTARWQWLDLARRGPCPAWYHIPSTLEWNQARDIWCQAKMWGEWCTSEAFAQALLLPYAGHRNSGSGEINSQWEWWYYWSSSRLSDDNAYDLNISSWSLNPQQDDRTPAGYSLRCFMNTSNKDIIYNVNGWDSLANWTAVSRWMSGSQLPTPTHSDSHKVFMWWYVSSWFEAGTQVTTTALSTDANDGSITLYAKWHDNRCAIDKEYDEENNLCYKLDTTYTVPVYYGVDADLSHIYNGSQISTITIKLANGDTLTMMDRNLWASVAWTSNTSYGELYQRWNNTPIKSASTDFINHLLPYENYRPGHPFNRSVFGSMWAGPKYNNLRWGWEDTSNTTSVDTFWWGIKNGETRQWPCPTWYHVPSAWEWNTVTTYWYNTTNPGNIASYTTLNSWSSVSTSSFSSIFKIPLAGMRGSAGSVQDQWSVGRYWTSSPAMVIGEHDIVSYVPHQLYFNSQYIETMWREHRDRGFGFSIRCFKDSPNAAETRIITFNENGGDLLWATWNDGEWTLIQKVEIWKKVQQPVNPTITGGTFQRWTSDAQWQTNFNFSIAITSSTPTTLYAQYTCDTANGYTWDNNGWCTCDAANWYHQVDGICSNIYTVTYNTNWWEWEFGYTPITWIQYWAQASQPDSSKLTKEWFVFEWWYENSDFSGDSYNFSTSITDNITLYAKWGCSDNYHLSGDNCEINTYTIIFDANNWTAATTQKVAHWQTGSAPTNPTHDKATFVEWCSDPEWTQAFNFNTPITADKTLYAKWICKDWYATLQWVGWLDRNCFAYEELILTYNNEKYVLMDRNLWARTAWDGSNFSTALTTQQYNSDSDYYGYYYRWWNNYGTEPGNLKFVYSNWSTNNQWPCPEWWHVPSSTEWNRAYYVWNNLPDKTISGLGKWVDFAKYLKLPTAGSDSSYAGNNGIYWSSDAPYEYYDTVSNALWFSSSSINLRSENSISNRFSVRCFMNDPKTLTFNLNGWDGAIDDIIVPSWTKAKAPVNPTNGDKTFAGWYTSTNNGTTLSSTTFDFDTAITEDVELYAKWCGAGETYYTELWQCATRDANNIVYYWTDENGKGVISIISGDIILTMMDKNLWASVAGLWSDSYGSYYQRWNNRPYTPWYWSYSMALYQNYWPWNPFLGNTYYTNGSENDYWSGVIIWNEYQEIFDNLWWWMWDNENNNWWWINNWEVRQWPCPTWYHVPSAWEWKSLTKFYYDARGRRYRTLPQAFNLPYWGYSNRANQSRSMRQWKDGRYQTSSPDWSNAKYFFISNELSSDKIISHARWFGGNIRCFKDSPNAPETLTLTFDENGGELLWTSTSTLDQLVASWHLAQQPVNPTSNNNGEVFSKWTTDQAGNGVAFNFSNPITASGTLYAQYRCDTANGYTENNNWECVRIFTVTFNTRGWNTINSITGAEGDKISWPQDPVKQWYWFDWWYKDADLQTRWTFSKDTLTANTELFAKWFEVNNLATTFWSTQFELLDRDLWADTAWTWYQSYGNFYQWWNNYGFSSRYLPANRCQGCTTNAASYWPNKPYRIDRFYGWIKTSSTLRWYWDSSYNQNLWWNTADTDEARRWPCPTWYHVPSKDEWNALLSAYQTWYNSASSSCTNANNVDCFRAIFNVPYAWRLIPYNYDNGWYIDGEIFENSGTNMNYRSSTPIPYAQNLFNAYTLSIPSMSVESDMTFYWYSVRCFKDNQTFDTVFTINYDTHTPSNIDSTTWLQLTKISEPDSHALSGYIFTGWYKDQNFQYEWNFDSDVLIDNMTLHAQWECDSANWYREVNGVCSNMYTVTWTITWNSTNGQLAYNSTPSHDNPSNYQTDSTIYTFSGWTKNGVLVDLANEVITVDVEYVALYDETPRLYTITFVDENDNPVGNTQNLGWDAQVNIPSVPVKSDDNVCAIYEWSWTPAVHNVTGDQQYKATYSCSDYKSYTITFVDENDNPVGNTQNLGWDAQVNIPSVPVKSDDNVCAVYEWSWTPAVHNVTGDQQYKPIYFCTNYKSYTITFVDENDSPVDTQNLGWDAQVNIPSVPAKSDDNVCAIYEWSWTPAVHNVTGNQQYKPTYSCTNYKSYTITFVDENDIPVDTHNLGWNAQVNIPSIPVKSSDDECITYQWSWTPEVHNVTGDQQYKATYSCTEYKIYTVTFINRDDAFISSWAYHYRDSVAAPSTPSKPWTNEFTYSFAGWTPDIIPVTWDQTYKATFTENIRNYTVTFKDWNNTLNLSPNSATYESKITLPAWPTKQWYIFNGWYKESTFNTQWSGTVDVITGDTIIYAKYDCDTANGYHANWTSCIKNQPSSSWWGGGGWSGKTWSSTKDKDDESLQDKIQEMIDDKNNDEQEQTHGSAEEQDNTSENIADSQTDNSESQTTDSSSNGNYTEEFKEAYTFAKSNQITTQPTIKEAKMYTDITRIEMAKMMSYYAMNILWQTPDVSRWTIKFRDVTAAMDKQYNNWVTLSYQLWIMWQNMRNNEFRPKDKVTRAEFATALSRMLYKTEDGKWKTKYYEPHIATLYNKWIINNTNPKLVEKRWYVMLMLMRSTK